MASYRRAVAVGISLALHGALLVVLAKARVPNERAKSEPEALAIEVEVNEARAPLRGAPAASTAQPLSLDPRAQRATGKRRGGQPPSKVGAPGKPAQSTSAAVAEAGRVGGESRGDDVPRRVQLTPGFAALPAPAPSEGEGAGPEPSSGAPNSLSSEEVRVKARVDQMLGDEIARQRVQKGMVDRYFGELKHALEKAVPEPPRFDAYPVRGFMSEWARTAQAYARGENPFDSGGSRSAPPSSVAGGRGDPAGLRVAESGASLDQAQTFRQSLESSGTAIFAVVEIRQKPNGKLKAIALVESSGYRRFDEYVLRMAPSAIEEFPEPPGHGPGIHPDGLRSTWAFIAKTVYRKKVRDIDLKKDWWYFAVAAPLALAGGSFDETTGEVWVTDLHDSKVQCDVRLLGVY